MFPQRLNPLAIRPACDTHKQIADNAQHISAFEGRWRFDLHHFSVLLNDRRNATNLLPPRLAARPGHDRKFIEHQCRIFQKAAIRTIVVGWDLKNIDSQASQQFLVAGDQ